MCRRGPHPATACKLALQARKHGSAKLQFRWDEGSFTKCFIVLLDLQGALHDSHGLPRHPNSNELTLIHLGFKK